MQHYSNEQLYAQVDALLPVADAEGMTI